MWILSKNLLEFLDNVLKMIELAVAVRYIFNQHTVFMSAQIRTHFVR